MTAVIGTTCIQSGHAAAQTTMSNCQIESNNLEMMSSQIERKLVWIINHEGQNISGYVMLLIYLKFENTILKRSNMGTIEKLKLYLYVRTRKYLLNDSRVGT